MVYFIGAGPGDPELLTIKAKKIIDSADVIIYAGSLVNKDVLKDAKKDALIFNSAFLNLEEIIAIILKYKDKLIARVHTGDPSIYGAIKEQIDLLKLNNIDYKIIPGVSSFLAAAASLEMEYTLPEVNQTIILTRMEGRTKVNEGQKIKDLAIHKACMVIFLSVAMIDKLVNELLSSYNITTKVAVCYKVTHRDEIIIRGNLSNIVDKVRKKNINKTALIIVGDVIECDYQLSKLYDKHFSHEYRDKI